MCIVVDKTISQVLACNLYHPASLSQLVPYVSSPIVLSWCRTEISGDKPLDATHDKAIYKQSLKISLTTIYYHHLQSPMPAYSFIASQYKEFVSQLNLQNSVGLLFITAGIIVCIYGATVESPAERAAQMQFVKQ